MFARGEMRKPITSQPLDERQLGDFTPYMRHYHAPSEPFASGDTLQTMLYRGWKPAVEVIRKVYWLSAMRSVSVYVFLMRRDEREMKLPVLVNPFVARLVRDRRLWLVPEDGDQGWQRSEAEPGRWS